MKDTCYNLFHSKEHLSQSEGKLLQYLSKLRALDTVCLKSYGHLLCIVLKIKGTRYVQLKVMENSYRLSQSEDNLLQYVSKWREPVKVRIKVNRTCYSTSQSENQKTKLFQSEVNLLHCVLK